MTVAVECSIKGCRFPAYAKGWCFHHRRRWLRKGDPEAYRPLKMPGKSEVTRFWNYVHVKGPSECWPWLTSTYAFGYGKFRYNGKTRAAHRIAYELTYSPPGEMCVLHTCDVPECCNPAHLFLGTRLENNRDMYRKGRARNGSETQTHCKRGHPLEGDNVYLWRRQRHCRMCSTLRARGYRQQKRRAVK